jgi:hypothetical protein
MRHRLGLRQADLSHEGAHHIAADMRMCLTDAAALAIVAITVVIVGAVAAPMVGVVVICVVAAPIIAVAVAVMMTRVTALGVEVVRLGHDRRRNANEYKRQQRSFLHCCWSPEFADSPECKSPRDHHARVKIFRSHNDEAIPRKADGLSATINFARHNFFRATIRSASRLILRPGGGAIGGDHQNAVGVDL